MASTLDPFENSSAASVLVVDDDTQLLNVISRMLRNSGIALTVVTSAPQALDLLARQNFDILVSDIQMPELSGHELAMQAKKLAPQTVRIFMTGLRAVDTAVQAINDGEVFRFLQKPFAAEEFLDAVRKGLERRRELDVAARHSRTSTHRRILLENLEREFRGICNVPSSPDQLYLIDLSELGDICKKMCWCDRESALPLVVVPGV